MFEVLLLVSCSEVPILQQQAFGSHATCLPKRPFANDAAELELLVSYLPSCSVQPGQALLCELCLRTAASVCGVPRVATACQSCNVGIYNYCAC